MEPRILTYDEKGFGDPIVLLPGGLTGWLSWIPHQERLAPSRRAIRVQPIHNELGSRGEMVPRDYAEETARESLRLTLDQLGVEAADFAGWSAGARSLLEFSLAYPERVRSVTLIEPPAYWVAFGSDLELLEMDRIRAFARRVAWRTISEEDLAEFLGLAGFAQPELDIREIPLWERGLPHRQTLSAEGSLMDSSRDIDELRGFERPVLLVKGTRSSDWLKAIVDQLATVYPRATLLELDGSHGCHIERIDEFMDALQKHLLSE